MPSRLSRGHFYFMTENAEGNTAQIPPYYNVPGTLFQVRMHVYFSSKMATTPGASLLTCCYNHFLLAFQLIYKYINLFFYKYIKIAIQINISYEKYLSIKI